MATSRKTNSPEPTGEGSKVIAQDEELAFAVAMLARLNERVPGVSVERTNISIEGQRVAVVIITGCVWDGDGKLVLLRGSNSE